MNSPAFALDAFCCQPGLAGAHEKGEVEGQIGYFRRNHLVPIPEVDSLDELNAMVDQWDLDDEARRIGARPRTVGELFAAEKPLLKPLPEKSFETGRWFHPRVDRHSQINIRTNRYSVPIRFIGRRVKVLLHANHLVVFDGNTDIARHERLPAKGGACLELDYYLEALRRKPGALPGATTLEQARAAGKFTPIHDAWWAEASKIHGDAAGTRALIEVLLLHRHLTHDHVVAGLAAARRGVDRRRRCLGGPQGRRRRRHHHFSRAASRRNYAHDVGDVFDPVEAGAPTGRYSSAALRRRL